MNNISATEIRFVFILNLLKLLPLLIAPHEKLLQLT